ncbi:MAG: hypothetical protein QXF52_06715 [Thermoproteota archaeon]
MANQHAYSFKEFLGLTILFIFAGVVMTVSILPILLPIPPEQPLIVFTDKNTYYTGETMSIYLVNILKDAEIRFDPYMYDLRFEKWVDGKWVPLTPAICSVPLPRSIDLPMDFNFTRFTRLEPLGSGRNKATVVYELGELFTEGKYRVGSFGEVVRNHHPSRWVTVYSEFNVSMQPSPPPRLRLEVATDKTVYHEDENITVTVKNTLNQTIKVIVRLRLWGWDEEKLPGSFCTGHRVPVDLEPGQTIQRSFNLPFSSSPRPLGNYWVVCEGWIEQDERLIYVWGYTEILIR